MNGVKIYYQCDSSNVLNEYIVHLAQEILFDKLRSKEKLGYIMSCSTYRVNEQTHGVYFNIQSDKCPFYLEERVENFLQVLKVSKRNLIRKIYKKTKKKIILRIQHDKIE